MPRFHSRSVPMMICSWVIMPRIALRLEDGDSKGLWNVGNIAHIYSMPPFQKRFNIKLSDAPPNSKCNQNADIQMGKLDLQYSLVFSTRKIVWNTYFSFASSSYGSGEHHLPMWSVIHWAGNERNTVTRVDALLTVSLIATKQIWKLCRVALQMKPIRERWRVLSNAWN